MVRPPPARLLWSLGATLLVAVVACAGTPESRSATPPPTFPLTATSDPPSYDSPSRSSVVSTTSPTAPPAPPQPAWTVGAQPLPLRPDGFGVVLPTPPALVDRMLPTVDVLPPPASGRFESTIGPVPAEVLARSTWQPACPVPPSRLRYLTMSFHGFDGRVHTGEMVVHSDAARTVVGVFERLFAARFRIEEMRVVDAPELTLAPTGDGNNTSAFVCRPARGQSSWSAHAYGLAVDLNPFQNPYLRGDLVLPELASAYLARDRQRPGMVGNGDLAVSAFEAAGWTWGGRWSQPTDLMHFSATGS